MKERTAREWLAEIDLARKREKDWREEAKTLWERYDCAKQKKNSYNIVTSNTQVLVGALYNSPPQPDVRRRFKDADPLGKAVSEVVSRCLAFGVDSPDFEASVKHAVLDLALPGRGVIRVRYEPSFNTVGEQETVEFERAPLEHVQWDKFIHGPGKTWDEVPWIGFDHVLRREQVVEKFGEEVAARIQYDELGEDQGFKASDSDLKVNYQTATITEIWDKDSKTVLFVNASVDDSVLLATPDPLGLTGFFPTPEPMRIIEDSKSLLPIPHPRLYKTQAEELEAIVGRINGIVNAMRIRGIKDGRLTELESMFQLADNQFASIENASLITQLGGIDKAIWMMPVDKLIQVLEGLYQAFESQKQQIYDIAGLADIMRGMSNPNETARAQQLKSDWGSMRLQTAQRMVQKYIRDLFRIQSEIIGNRFQPATIKAMTGIPIDDQIFAVMRSPEMRQYRIDVETDSTISESISTDMQGLAQVLQGLVQWLQGAPVALQSGVMTLDGVKQVALAIVRRAKMGSVVEDAIDQQGAAPGMPGMPMQPGQPMPAGAPGAPQQPGQPAPVDPAIQQIQQQEEFEMQQVQQALVALQQLMQRAEQDRMQFEQQMQAGQQQAQELQAIVQQTMQQTVEQVTQAVQGALGQLQQQFAQMQMQHASVLNESSTLQQRTVQDALGADLSAALAGLSDAVNRMAAPREVVIQRDAQGRPIGAVSAPGTMQ